MTEQEQQVEKDSTTGKVRANAGAQLQSNHSDVALTPVLRSLSRNGPTGKVTATGLSNHARIAVDMREHFYDDERTLRQALSRIASAPMADANRQHIRRFATVLEAEGMSKLRIVKYLYHLTTIGRLIEVDFAAATRTDIVGVFAAIERKQYAAWTKRDFRAVCKRFYKWLRDSEGYPDEVRWLRCTMQGVRRRLPEEMLTEEEIRRLVTAADNARDRALVLLLYESGCRVGEIGRLRIRNVEFDDFGARLIVSGKTGMRRVRVVGAAPPLATWLSLHPFRQDPDAALWIGLGQVGRGRPLNYPAIARMLSRLAVKAGINKHIHPHLFRHSRATELASKLTEAQLKEMFGWTQSSRQAATYVHLSGRNVDDAVLKLYGIQNSPAATDESSLKPTRCLRCDTPNVCDAQFCQRCGLPTSQLAALNAEEQRKDWDSVMSKLVADPEVQTVLVRKLREMNVQPPT